MQKIRGYLEVHTKLKIVNNEMKMLQILMFWINLIEKTMFVENTLKQGAWIELEKLREHFLVTHKHEFKNVKNAVCTAFKIFHWKLDRVKSLLFNTN